MNTKKAIEFLESQKEGKDEVVPPYRLGVNLMINEIIELLEEGEELGQIKLTPQDFYNRSEYVDKLKRGEKFEKIVEELEKLNVYGITWRLEEIKQKYFPEPKDKCNECVYKFHRNII